MPHVSELLRPTAEPNLDVVDADPACHTGFVLDRPQTNTPSNQTPNEKKTKR